MKFVGTVGKRQEHGSVFNAKELVELRTRQLKRVPPQ